MTKPVAKFATVLLLFALIPFTVLSIDEDKTGAAVKEQIDWDAGDVSVLFFILHDCPICNRYVPEMNGIARDYRGRGFRFTAVYSDIDFPAEEARKHWLDFHFDFPFVIDADHRLAAQLGIKVVPQVAVLNRKHELLYRGRIDDLYADVDKQRPAATHRDLREALENIAAGIKPTRPWRPPVGCPIGYDQPGS